MMLRRAHFPYFIAALLLIAFALRNFRLGAQSLWWDEGISLHLATSSVPAIIRDRLDNIHPPLYFLLLKGWLALTGVSAFTGRYLSALASQLQVALVFALALSAVRSGRTATQRPARAAAWLAAGLMAVSPLSVIYAQEIRVYAFLPVLYFAMLWVAGRVLAEHRAGSPRPGPDIGKATRGHGLPALLAVLEWLAVHLHYIAIFAVAYIALWGLAAIGWRRRDAPALRRWLVAHALVLVASLPWLFAVANNWPAIRAEASAGTFTTEPVPLAYLFAQVWAFHLTGLAGALASQWVRIGAAATALFGLGLLFLKIRVRAKTVRSLAAHWSIPLLSALLVWSVRSFSHPRYVIMFAAIFVVLVAFLLVSPWRGLSDEGDRTLQPQPTRLQRGLHYALALLFGALFISLNLWGLNQYFFDPETAKPDMRGVARYLENVAGPDDLILIPDTDWSFPFEYRGEAQVMMPEARETRVTSETALAHALDCRGEGPCASSRTVFTIDYPRGTRDWAGRVPFELERRGEWLNETPFDDVAVREYRLRDETSPLPTCDADGLERPDAHYGPLVLSAAWLEQGAPANTAVTVALCWRLAQPTGVDYVLSLFLSDPVTGERVAQSDARLLDLDGAPTRRWWPDSVVTFHILPLPPGTPPVTLNLAAGVYADETSAPILERATDSAGGALGQLVTVGDVTLSSPAGLPASPYGVASPPPWETPWAAANGLQLLGARVSPGPYRPGQIIRVGLTWRPTGALPDLQPLLRLERGSKILAESSGVPVQGRYPTGQWVAGQMVSEFRDVRVPVVDGGPATITLSVGERTITLGDVTLDGAPLQLEPPRMTQTLTAQFGDAIRLAGFDPPPAQSGPPDDLPLALYWQSLSGAIDTGYTVFVHLVAGDGRLLAQHDGIPASGARPTNEWLAGEYVTDTHVLAWREEATGYIGPARLIVGLYDAATGERLRTPNGADSVELPVNLTITAKQ